MKTKISSLYCVLIGIIILFCHTTIYGLENKFVSLKFSEVNSRAGPSTKYPIIWIYKRKFLPLKLLDQYDNWRQIQDIKGDISWMHVSAISRYRSVIITALKGKTLYVKPNMRSAKLAILKNNVQCTLKNQNTNWCKLECDGLIGWASISQLWGV